MEFRRVGFETRQSSPLSRKGRGSHPVLGPDLKQRDGRREKVGAIPCGCPQFRSRIKTFVNNHLLDPDFFLGGRRMNFHKTIGFLASLLLVLGLGVPDSFAQDIESVSVSPRTIVEGSTASVRVTVTLSEAPDAGTTVTVNLTHNANDVAGVALADNSDPAADPLPALANFTAIEIIGPAVSKSSMTSIKVTDDENYVHPRTKDVTITADGGGASKTTTFAVREDDSAKGALMLSSDPRSLSVGGDGSATVTVSIPAAPGATDGTDNTVSVTFTADTDGSVAAAEIAGTAKSTTVALTGVTVTDEGMVTITAMATNYTPGMLTIPIISRTAGDLEGFRVTMLPADGAWVGFGKKKVKVEVTRVNNYANDWTRFESIKVALRDTLAVTGLGSGDTAGDIYSLTASGFAKQDGEVVFSSVASNGGAFPGNNNITYDEAGDKLLFEFELVKVLDETAASTALGSAPSGDAREGDTAMGQRRGVFARATFAPPFTTGGSAGMIDSKDTKMKVFSAPALLGTIPESQQVVGDGKLIKIDLMSPANAATADNLMTSVEGGAMAKIGDVIRVAVGVGTQTRFREGGMQILIKSIDTPQQNVTATTKTIKTVNFSPLDVINAAGDSIRASVELTEGLLASKAKANGSDRDGSDIKKAAAYEGDNMNMEILARTKDQAGNWSGSQKVTFTADTRKPGISVLHPVAGSHFSGAHADVFGEEHLMPLQLRVDEEITSMSVYAAGAGDEKAGTGTSIIALWTDGNRDFDRSLVAKEAGANAIGDTISYGTKGLKWRDAKGVLKATGQAGTKIDLVIEATDMVGNKTKMTLAGVFHDEKMPTITDFFPRNSLLTGDDNQINDATRHPVFTLKEAVDSLSITYDGSSGEDIVHVVADGLPKGEHQEIIADPFVHDRTYTLTIFARDLAGNAFETSANDAADLKFNEQFDNPIANVFKVTYAETDSVIAGQVNDIMIEAYDDNGTATGKDDRKAITHKGAAMISAWDMAGGGQSSSVRFLGGGVTDNGDGSAMLNADAWKLGARTVHVVSNKNIGLTKLLVQNLMAGEDGTKVPTFEGAVDSFYVGAADFVGFEITAWQDGNDVTDRGVTGNFDLLVRPVDRYGNSSVRAYMGATGKKSEADSLSILDTRIKTAIEYKQGIDVTFASIPPLEELNPLFVFPIEKGGTTFPILLPESRRSLTVQVRVDNDNLDTDDMRSMDVRTTSVLKIVMALNPMLTLWVPGSDMDEAGNDVVIPADPGDVTVTVAAEGYNAGSMVTFTKDGTAMDPVAADDGGVAKLMITMSAAGSVTVSATDGHWDAEALTITFVEGPDEPVRMSYVDANGDPVYLVDMMDNTVDLKDYMLFRAAWGMSASDDINGDGMVDATDAQIFLQSDINDDGMVGLADYEMLIMSWGKTAANGPASKPLVLAPGVNENAEFSLSLGSERVIAGEMVAVDVSLANVAALMGYGFTLNYETDNFEFVSVAPADEDLLKSTGGETPLFHHIAGDGQVEVVNGMVNGSAISGGGDIVRFVFRVLREFEDNARFEIANGLVFDPTNLSNLAVVAGVLELQSTPREFALHQNFPNPFNPDTTIKYDLAESADVTLQIYNVLGQVVRTLVASEAQNAGRYQIRWNGMDDRGVPVSSGIYFYQIAADGKFSDVRKLMLLK